MKANQQALADLVRKTAKGTQTGLEGTGPANHIKLSNEAGFIPMKERAAQHTCVMSRNVCVSLVYSTAQSMLL